MQTDYIPMNANRPATTTPLDPTDTIRSVEQAEALLAYVEELVSLAQLAHTKEPYHVTPPDYPLPANFKLSLVIPVYNEERTIRLIGRVRYHTPPSCTHVGTGLVGQKRARMRSSRQL